MTNDQEQLVMSKLKDVKIIARAFHKHIRRKLPLDDLEQAGRLGLVQAALRFDPTLGLKFTTIAERRIVGSIKDLIRKEYGRKTHIEQRGLITFVNIDSVSQWLLPHYDSRNDLDRDILMRQLIDWLSIRHPRKANQMRMFIAGNLVNREALHIKPGRKLTPIKALIVGDLHHGIDEIKKYLGLSDKKQMKGEKGWKRRVQEGCR